MTAFDVRVLPTDSNERSGVLHALVQDNPEAALAAAEGLLAVPASRGMRSIRADLGWIVGRCQFELGQLDAAEATLRSAARQARAVGHRELAGRVRMSLAIVEAEGGRSGAALATLRLAERDLPADELSRLRSQRTLVLCHRGELDAAAAEASAGLQEVRRIGDTIGVLRQLVNRSIVYLNSGDLVRAEADLREARPIAIAKNQRLVAAGIEHNLAVAAARGGSLPLALQRFDDARVAYEAVGSPARVLLLLATDRAEALLRSGLASEAVVSASDAIELARGHGHEASRAEAVLLWAQALHLVGRECEAAAAARQAEDAFRLAGRAAWATRAAALAWELDAADSLDARAARRMVAALNRSGWNWEAERLRGLLAQRLIEAGRPLSAIPELRATRRQGPLPVRIAWTNVAALAADRRRDQGMARRIIESGLRAIESHRATWYEAELRAGASVLGRPLADLALRLAVRGGDAWELLAAAERWRWSAAATTPPASDDELSRRLAVLRSTRAWAATIDPGHPAYRRAVSAVLRAESDVTDRARVAVTDPNRGDRRPSRSALQRELGRRILLEYTQVDGAIHAVVLRNGRATVAALGPEAPISACVVATAGSMARAVALRSTRTIAHFRADLARLDSLLVGSLDLSEGEPLVVSPIGRLGGVPWGALPTLWGRAFTVVPSAAQWYAAARRRRTVPRPTAVVAVAGPDLVAADAEAAEVAATVGGRSLLGAAATLERVLAELSISDTAHIAAHGRFRSDNPTFSSLRLADGELLVRDLERLVSLPSTVVLSACRAAATSVAGVDDLIGTVATLLARGTTSVIAPLELVHDTECARLMPTLHRTLAEGVDSGEALRRMRVNAAGDDHTALTADSFVAFGV